MHLYSRSYYYSCSGNIRRDEDCLYQLDKKKKQKLNKTNKSAEQTSVKISISQCCQIKKLLLGNSQNGKILGFLSFWGFFLIVDFCLFCFLGFSTKNGIFAEKIWQHCDQLRTTGALSVINQQTFFLLSSNPQNHVL